ncbi:WD domain G-beta repeat [Carpediemonas membranifera]|uniref:WD domain G-beta repeat n=1 Tax=Carpediemonas membranifera TaxID=201153 RepID=A0A8J6BDE6_9EUKA|nr:WD domain G-beta repeat [Carpediemonas membranifera]|eukprot:KAG9395172.1 WD domain G-beta repeat [Carpediemonas membranifera]
MSLPAGYSISRDPLTDPSFAKRRSTYEKAPIAERRIITSEALEKKRVPFHGNLTMATNSSALMMKQTCTTQRPHRQFERLPQYALSIDEHITSIAIQPVHAEDESVPLFAVGTEGGQVHVFEFGMRLVGRCLAHSQQTVTALAFSTIHPYIYSGSTDNSVKLLTFDRAAGQLVESARFNGSTATIKGVGSLYFPFKKGENDMVYGVALDTELRAWDVTGGQLHTRPAQSARVATGCLSMVAIPRVGEGSVVVVGTRGGDVRAFRADRAGLTQMGQPLQLHERSVVAMALWYDDGAPRIVTASSDRVVCWDFVPTGPAPMRMIGELELADIGLTHSVVRAVAATDDGLIAMAADGVHLLDAHSLSLGRPSLVGSLPLPQDGHFQPGPDRSVVTSVAFDATATRLLVGSTSTAYPFLVYGQVED